MAIENTAIDSTPILGLAKGYEEQAIEIGSDTLMKWSIILDIGKHGAWVDGHLIFSENQALRNMRDVADTKRWAEFRHIKLIEISTTQDTTKEIIKYVDEEVTQSHYPHGVVADYSIKNEGFRVIIESLDMYANDSLNIRKQVKHRQVAAIPIIENGSLIGLGVILKVNDEIRKRSYRG